MPVRMRVVEREMAWLVVRAMRSGRNVPRSPREPDISESGCWRKVVRLCAWLRRSRVMKEEMMDGILDVE